MAHFYGNIVGDAKTDATRQGSKDSGIAAHIRGWHVGIRVVGECVNPMDKADESDTFKVYLTGGSGDSKDWCLIATVGVRDHRPTILQLVTKAERGLLP